MKNKKRKTGLGLLAERRQVEQKAAAADPQKSFGGRVPDPALQREPDPTDFPGKVPKKKYQAPCFFSCTPDGWERVDVYKTATIVHGQPGVNLAEYIVPEGKIFRFEAMGNNWSSGGGGSLFFRVAVNKDAIGTGFANFTHQMGDINILDMYPLGINIRGDGKTVVAVQVRNDHTTIDYDAFARIKGILGPDI